MLHWFRRLFRRSMPFDGRKNHAPETPSYRLGSARLTWYAGGPWQLVDIPIPEDWQGFAKVAASSLSSIQMNDKKPFLLDFPLCPKRCRIEDATTADAERAFRAAIATSIMTLRRLGYDHHPPILRWGSGAEHPHCPWHHHWRAEMWKGAMLRVRAALDAVDRRLPLHVAFTATVPPPGADQPKMFLEHFSVPDAIWCRVELPRAPRQIDDALPSDRMALIDNWWRIARDSEREFGVELVFPSGMTEHALAMLPDAIVRLNDRPWIREIKIIALGGDRESVDRFLAFVAADRRFTD